MTSCWELCDCLLPTNSQDCFSIVGFSFFYFEKDIPMCFLSLWTVGFVFIFFFSQWQKNTRLVSCRVVFAREALYLKMKGKAMRSCI